MLPAVTPSIIGVIIFMSPPKKSAEGSCVRLVVRRGQGRGEVFEQGAVRLDRLMSPERPRDGQRFERASAA